MIVIDASVSLEWLLDQGKAVEADAVLRRAAAEGAMVPQLFWLEVANVLRTRVRRGLVSPAFRDASLADLRRFGLVSDAQGGAVFDTIIALSDRHDLTVYDASYLELALRLGAPLFTFDAALAAAAKTAGA